MCTVSEYLVLITCTLVRGVKPITLPIPEIISIQCKQSLCHFLLTISPYMFLKALWLSNKCSFQNYTTFFVTLVLLIGKLVDPAKLLVAVLAHHVPDHMSPCQHDPVLYLAILQVYNFVEKESTTCSTCNSSNWNKTLLDSVMWYYHCSFAISSHINGWISVQCT